MSSVVILFREVGAVICHCPFCSSRVLGSRCWRTRHLFLIVAVNANHHNHLDLWMRAVLARCFLPEGWELSQYHLCVLIHTSSQTPKVCKCVVWSNCCVQLQCLQPFLLWNLSPCLWLKWTLIHASRFLCINSFYFFVPWQCMDIFACTSNMWNCFSFFDVSFRVTA